jgi:hypothetical protein
VREVRQRLALVVRTGDPGSERGAERSERLSLAELGLAVADPDLDRREREVRADAPPELGVLGDGAGPVKEADVALELGPAAVGVGNAAAREHPREDLRARRMETAVDGLDKRRAGRER